MNIPDLFKPKRDLEEKIIQLLEKPILKKFEDDEKEIEKDILYQEVEKEFSNFIGYLLKLHQRLRITKSINNSTETWRFYKTYPSSTSPMNVGIITTYVEEICNGTSGYGYQARLLVKGQWKDLKYRKGLHCFDTSGNIVSIKDPFRYDKLKDVPFP